MTWIKGLGGLLMLIALLHPSVQACSKHTSSGYSASQHEAGLSKPWPPTELTPLSSLPVELPTTLLVSSDSREAQFFFNYGLAALHSFAYLEAYRSFQQALKLDNDLPMAHWGKAYSLLGAGRTGAALDKIISQATAGLAKVSDLERLYIKALTAYTRSDEEYVNALEILIEQYPNELDAKLFLALFMNDGYQPDGQPINQQAYAKAILQPLLTKYPQHVGVHHYWVHATEASKYPERASLSVAVLENAKSSFGHIVHMPGHLAWLDNNYSKAVTYFTAAEMVDRNYLQHANISPADYWSYQHNLAYRVVAELEAGEIDAAQQSLERAAILYENYPTKASQQQWHRFQSIVGSRIFMRGGRWQASKEYLTSLPLIDGEQPVRLLHSSALAVLNIDSNNPQEDTVAEAVSALEDLREYAAKHSEDPFLQMLLYEAEAVASAMHGNGKATVKNFQQALHFERLVNYEEPPLRVRTIHETAGQTFCHFGSFDFGIQMYQQAVKARPNNGHALQGMIACLIKKGDIPMSEKFKAQLDTLWPAKN